MTKVRMNNKRNHNFKKRKGDMKHILEAPCDNYGYDLESKPYAELQGWKRRLESELKCTSFTDWVIVSQELEAVNRELIRRRDGERQAQ